MLATAPPQNKIYIGKRSKYITDRIKSVDRCHHFSKVRTFEELIGRTLISNQYVLSSISQHSTSEIFCLPQPPQDATRSRPRSPPLRDVIAEQTAIGVLMFLNKSPAGCSPQLMLHGSIPRMGRMARLSTARRPGTWPCPSPRCSSPNLAITTVRAMTMLERHRDKHRLWYFKVCLESRPLMLGAACFTGRYCLASYLFTAKKRSRRHYLARTVSNDQPPVCACGSPDMARGVPHPHRLLISRVLRRR